MTASAVRSPATEPSPGVVAALRELRARIRDEAGHNDEVVNLTSSENRMSPLAREPIRHDFYNRYFFNPDLDADRWAYRGGEGVADVEVDVALPALRRLARAEHVNVRAVSGMSAMFLALFALGGEPGDAIVSIAQSTGGHYATQSVITRIGRRAVSVPQLRGHVDDAALRAVLEQHRPALVYLDLQNSLSEIDVAGVVRAVREVSPATRVHADISHTLGLVLGGVHGHPLDLGADTMGGSTHKTFPGPQKGALFTRDAELAARITHAQFDTISSHHFAETLSLGLAAIEFETFGHAYASAVIGNARALGRALLAAGFDVVVETPDITDSHQVWVRMPHDRAALDLADALSRAGVRANLLDDLPGTDGRQTFRLGVAELTFEGADADHMATVAGIFTLARASRIVEATRLRRELRAGLRSPYFLPETVLDGAAR